MNSEIKNCKFLNLITGNLKLSKQPQYQSFDQHTTFPISDLLPVLHFNTFVTIATTIVQHIVRFQTRQKDKPNI